MSISRKNQREAYDAILDKLPTKNRVVFNLVGKYPKNGVTAYELSITFSIPINEITGRLSELKKHFYIDEVGSRKNTDTGRKNTVYKVVNGVLKRNKLILKEKGVLTKRYVILHNDYQNAFLSQSGKYLIKKELLKLKSLITKLSNLSKTLCKSI